MRQSRRTGRVLSRCAVSLLVLILAPAVLVAGEPVSRWYLRGRRARRIGPVAGALLTNPVWIALTAPARWVTSHLRPRAGSGRRGGNGDPGAGVREPRRPLPDLPAGAVALPGPRSSPLGR